MISGRKDVKMLILLVFSIFISSLNAVLYECYSGKPASQQKVQLFTKRNNTQYCLIDVKPCNESDWRRVDGSCNNLKWPSRGMVRTPTIKFLPPVFSKEYEPRKAKNGGPLPLERKIRTQVLLEGQAHDSVTLLVAYMLLTGVNDINSLHDALNPATNTTNCCTPEGKSNYICAPNKIPEDDPVHRYSGVRCTNHTRPQSFQYFGCIDFGTTQFVRITFATPVFDLSGVYNDRLGAVDAIDKMRTFKKGLLKTEIDNGKIFPLSDPSPNNNCLLNQRPKETRCHKYQVNGGVGTNILLIAFYRQHNRIAKKLAELNPSWNDDRLFFTARDINIAIFVQIYFYELLPSVLGRKNMIKDGVISCSDGFRDLYKNEPPQMSDEFVFVYRWFHTIQETELKLFDKDGCFLKRYPSVNLTTRTGILPREDYLEQLYQGSFRQRGAKFDYAVANDIVERAFGGIAFAVDASTNHLAKGRLLGFQPYVKYREFCAKKPYKTFDSLEDVMCEERIYRLSEIYDDVEDVDLIAGLWAEKRIPGGRIPRTMYCLIVEQLKRTIASDRHWYERPNRPHAFTMEQLQAIRKTTIAGLLCTCADGVTKIQANAFYKISPKNPLIDCNSSKIGKIDLSPWKEEEEDEEE